MAAGGVVVRMVVALVALAAPLIRLSYLGPRPIRVDDIVALLCEKRERSLALALPCLVGEVQRYAEVGHPLQLVLEAVHHCRLHLRGTSARHLIPLPDEFL